jgi:hypothetical protein
MQTSGIKLNAKSYKRTAFWPMLICIIVGLVLCTAWLGITINIFLKSNAQFLFGVIIGLSTLAYIFYLSYIGINLIADSKKEFSLEFNDNEATLKIIDRLRRKQSIQMVLLNDVKYAEFYPFTDSASVVLHAAYADMEIPLWPLGSHAQDVIDYLQGQGIKIVNVQSDDQIPN